MQAIILAAGMGKRLGALTRNNTKCMIQVNGVTLIERMMRQLDRLSPSLEKIVIVTGYEGEKLKNLPFPAGHFHPCGICGQSPVRQHQQYLFPVPGQGTPASGRYAAL